MQTAMKRHIEWLKCRVAISKEFEKALLEEEKQQIINAYIDRIKDTYQNRIEAEQYYNRTFKQE